MFNRTAVFVLMLAAAAAGPVRAQSTAAGNDEAGLTRIRAEIAQLRQAYEGRIQALEQRLQDAEARLAPAPAVALPAPVAPSPATRSAANSFNPEIGLILGGTYANLSRDPQQFRIQGFVPAGGEIGPGARSFSLGESELRFSANIDPLFSGRLTAALGGDNSVAVEEALVQSRGLANGLNVQAGRFLSSLGYLNAQHRHVWDFVDAPLAYQAFLGGQYRQDGLQVRWLAPTERFIEAGLEVGNGAGFPGSDRNRNGVGATTLFAHVGDDLGESSSWRVGLSYLRTAAADRAYDDVDSTGTGISNTFAGRSRVWVADAIYKWAPEGNATQRNFKLQGEYFRRTEAGSLTYDSQAQSLGTATGAYRSAQSGAYLQGVYQFMASWRAGLRVDRLAAGRTQIGLVDAGVRTSADFPGLASYKPARTSLMFDYSPTEFSRLRLQFARDRSRPGIVDNQIFLQYIMSLGAHGAHAF